jgi:hypothetical protein
MTLEYDEIMERKQVSGTHYEKMAIQPVEYIHANGLDFFEGNVVKYISRHRTKNGAEDVKKAIDYCLMILENDYGIKYESK